MGDETERDSQMKFNLLNYYACERKDGAVVFLFWLGDEMLYTWPSTIHKQHPQQH